MIIETSWGTGTGWIVVRDTLLMGPWRHEETRSATHRRTPNDYEAEHILLRTIRCVSGEVRRWGQCWGVSMARCREASISASASARPTHSAPSTDLPGSRSL